MSAKATVELTVVTPATVQANLDALVYVSEQLQILGAAAAVAAALIAEGQPQGAVVAALVPVIQAQVMTFPTELLPATLVAQAAFV